ncbi:cytochrome c oxidase subunit I [Caldalkalibacillus thermarum TA2.A1]|uniref:Cytochrome c oxidase subunit I n=1 Tax=Caldalkalibacillus thermarum (strain TA2.A1) TaxID=986075 RepID=F5L5U5_CALTT|nr:cbb3-type cytochrome c oxidase subunit I [Caldalkalibacillus thermarum]EGL83300.1 cytochrome c oxidase subunit I [Caldalkalibacillus thermarum TA2.A1]QZT33215.1 cbb3-type cytochrome c oxidase subunit I [Caldalkalibacillus thermarum TA2.A1]
MSTGTETVRIETTFNRRINRWLGVKTEDAQLAKSYLLVSFVALFLGGLFGLLQGLNRAGLLELPTWFTYYQVLTAHGLMLVVIFSGFFMIGYFYAGLSHTLGGLLPGVRKMGWLGFGLGITGTLLVVVMVLLNEATVLYTFYPPMQAHPIFYFGLVLIVLGIWMCCFGAFIQVARWRKQNKGQHLPILAFFATGAFVLLLGATSFVAVEVIFLIIPWSLGWVETINVMLARTLFWAFGHTAVNIWYLTAVSAWYVIVPRIIGGTLWNDTLTRVVVVMLVIMNITGGFHHQIVDPGITDSIKYMHVFMSLAIGFPSLMTAYALFAVMERTGRKKGGTGAFGWLRKLPWGDVRFLAPFMGMVAFIFGGAGGIAQTTFQLNAVVHNTMWIVGHFHLTLGMSVALTFFGLSYWLIPHLSGRVLTPQLNKLGVIQTVIWTAAMVLMTVSMHTAGLLGSPRRTSYTTFGDHAAALGWDPYMLAVGIGAVLLTLGVLIQFYAVIQLMFFAPEGQTEFPVAEKEPGDVSGYWTERWGVWVVLMIIVVSMAYVVPIVDMLVNAPPGSPPFRTW